MIFYCSSYNFPNNPLTDFFFHLSDVITHNKKRVTEKKNEAMVSSTHCTSVSASPALATINGQANNKFAFFLFGATATTTTTTARATLFMSV